MSQFLIVLWKTTCHYKLFVDIFHVVCFVVNGSTMAHPDKRAVTELQTEEWIH